MEPSYPHRHSERDKATEMIRLGPSRRDRVLVAFGVIAVVLLALSCAGLALSTNADQRNQSMYLAAGNAVAGGDIPYLDFPYHQTPYHPYFLGFLFVIFGGSPAITGTFAMIAMLFGISFLAFWEAKKRSQSALVGLGFGALPLLAHSLARVAIEPSNYLTASFFSALSVVAMVRCAWPPSLERARSSVTKVPSGTQAAMLSGFCLSVAVGMKLSAVGIVPGLVFALLAAPVPWARRVQRLSVFFLAAVLGGAGALLLFAQSPDHFWFHNVTFHRITTEYKIAVGITRRLSVGGRALGLVDAMSLATNAALVLPLLGALFQGVTKSKSKSDELSPIGAPRLAFAFLILVGGVLTALAPSPYYVQYSALPLVLALTLGATFASRSGAKSVLAVTVVLGLLGAVEPIRDGLRGLHTDAWAGVRAWPTIRRLRDAPIEGPVATLEPTLVLEAGYRIYPELASGPFMVRVADRISETRRSQLGVATLEELFERFEEEPPGAIFVRNDRRYFAPLVEFARTHGYEEERLPEGALWLPPSPRPAPTRAPQVVPVVPPPAAVPQRNESEEANTGEAEPENPG